MQNDLTLITGGTGKTGRRIADRLTALGHDVRIGSRSAEIPFDWEDRATWGPALDGATAVYIAFQPDLAIPGTAAVVEAFTDLAVERGARRLVLLSGRGEAEAQECERVVLAAGVPATVVRASWFMQNFSEGYLAESVDAGVIALPAGDVGEPFIDADDIADVAVAALTDERHAGEVYDVTGPRLLTFAEATAELGRATGRELEYVQLTPGEFSAEMAKLDLPGEVAWLLEFLFGELLDGRNAHVTDGVERALGRQPRDFAQFAGSFAGV